ncbi:unnamed protein product [Musa hybrid cultivar]
MVTTRGMASLAVERGTPVTQDPRREKKRERGCTPSSPLPLPISSGASTRETPTTQEPPSETRRERERSPSSPPPPPISSGTSTRETPTTLEPRSEKRRERGSSPSSLPPPPISSGASTPDAYEKVRDERIRENMERLQKLGILDLSFRLKSHLQHASSSAPSYHHRRKRDTTTGTTSGQKPPMQPPRRSSRLQHITPVSYAEIPIKKDVGSEMNGSISIEEGAKEEIYTDEHEKLLGKCETTWNLFVDGYGNDGRRIYDQIRGKTCHQCRQKTLGHRTHCSKCKIFQGQFCGDCLFMRYGENVLEAMKNPNWICPVCRGICNCSFCRIKRGWGPTGPMYRKIARMGYKSVAHYLIQSRRQQTSSGDLNSSESVSAEDSSNINADFYGENSKMPSTIKLGSNIKKKNESFPEKENESLSDKENESLPENGVRSSDDYSAEDTAEKSPTKLRSKIKKKNESCDDIKPIHDSVASRLRKRHKT